MDATPKTMHYENTIINLQNIMNHLQQNEYGCTFIKPCREHHTCPILNSSPRTKNKHKEGEQGCLRLPEDCHSRSQIFKMMGSSHKPIPPETVEAVPDLSGVTVRHCQHADPLTVALVEAVWGIYLQRFFQAVSRCTKERRHERHCGGGS